jgi:xanthine/uracil/vitamin C permease (AzgA family)
MSDKAPKSASLFDLRTVIAVLFGIYGAVLTVMGLLGTSPEQLEKAGGIALNLWTGIGMLVVAGLFVLWLVLRPSTVGATDDAAQPVRGDRPGGH